jgi:hypothetical protein
VQYGLDSPTQRDTLFSDGAWKPNVLATLIKKQQLWLSKSSQLRPYSLKEKAMKKVRRLLLFVLLALLILGGCATAKYVPKPNEELYGNWTNEYTGNNDNIQKQVYSASGWKDYHLLADTVPVDQGTFQIDSKWTDANGNIWYRSYCTQKTGPAAGFDSQMLSKLSKSATILEWVYKQSSPYAPVSYPTQIDTKSDTYHIFYRTGG